MTKKIPWTTSKRFQIFEVMTVLNYLLHVFDTSGEQLCVEHWIICPQKW